MSAVLPLSFVSCADAEEGEDWDTWIMRNMLNSGWTLDRVKVDGEYKETHEAGVHMYYDIKLRSNGRTFTAKRFFYGPDGIEDESTEINKSGTFTADGKNKVIEATDSEGNKFFRLTNIDFMSGYMVATLYFYDLDKSYDAMLGRFY